MRVVLPFKLVGQKLVKGRDFPKSVADGSKDSVVIRVDGIPDGCIAKGYFKLSWENNTTYDLTFNGDELVVDEHIVTLPAYATNKYIDYKFSFSVAIWEGDIERLTTSPVEIVVEKSNYVKETTNTPEVPQSQYDALAQMTAEAKGAVAEYASELNNARIDFHGQVFDSVGENIRKGQETANAAGGLAAQVREQVNNSVLPRLQALEDGGLQIKDEYIAEQVNNWLDAHPEATTTVQDGAITEAKLHDNLHHQVYANGVDVYGYGLRDDMNVTQWLAKFNECVKYCRDNGYVLTAHDLKLKADVDLTALVGCKLTGETLTNGYTIKIGNSKIPRVAGTSTGHEFVRYDFNQITNPDETGKVVLVSPFYNSWVNIGSLKGVFSIQTSDEYTGIAYNHFNLGTVTEIHIEPAAGSQNAGSKHWVNENTFNLQRTKRFIVEDMWMFDNNTINGGCFEGDYRIELKVGTENIFNHMRFEGSKSDGGAIILSAKTQRNLFRYRYPYHFNIVDDGLRNIIYEETNAPKTLVSSDTVTVETLDRSAFIGGTIDTETNSIAFNVANNVAFYSSPYISEPHKAIFRVHSALAYDHGVAVKYRFYDEDFNELDQSLTDGLAFYMTTTAKNPSVNDTEGQYFLGHVGNINCVPDEIDDEYNSAYINVVPTGYFTPNYGGKDNSEALAQMKYVRFFLVTMSYYNTQLTRYKSISANVYTMSDYQYADQIL